MTSAVILFALSETSKACHGQFWSIGISSIAFDCNLAGRLSMLGGEDLQ